METLVSWVLLAVLQTQGFVGVGFSTQQECESTRLYLLQQEDTVAVSACVQIPLTMKAGQQL